MTKDLTYLKMFLEAPTCCSVGNGLEDNRRKTIMVILGDTTAAWTRILVAKVGGGGHLGASVG